LNIRLILTDGAPPPNWHGIIPWSEKRNRIVTVKSEKGKRRESDTIRLE
jgi:hypothetical protein